jgi:hypothetical protein
MNFHYQVIELQLQYKRKNYCSQYGESIDTVSITTALELAKVFNTSLYFLLVVCVVVYVSDGYTVSVRWLYC